MMVKTHYVLQSLDDLVIMHEIESSGLSVGDKQRRLLQETILHLSGNGSRKSDVELIERIREVLSETNQS